MRENLYEAGSETLFRNYCGGPGTTDGFADDYAFFIQGLLDLYETGFDLAYLRWALALQETQNRRFAAPEGGFFSVSDEDASILLRIREDYDGAEPSANSIATLNLLRLAEMTGRADFRELAEGTLRSFAPQLGRVPSAAPQMLVALDWLLHPPIHYAIVGDRTAESLIDALRAPFLPRKILLRIDGKESRDWFAERLPHLRDAGPVAERAAVYRCENFTCSLPVTDPADLP